MFDDLFIEQQRTKVVYSRYYVRCNPSACTYLYTRRFDLVFMLTIVVGVVGGLATILKLLTPFLVRLALTLRKKHHPRMTSRDERIHMGRSYGKFRIELLEKDIRSFF
jgi:hypothetical protein